MRQQRVIIENVSPRLNCGEFFIKRIVGESITVYADVIPDGHDVIQAEIRYRHEDDKEPSEVRMLDQGQDVYYGTFEVPKQGFYEYGIRAWVDHALNWQHGIEAKLKDGQYVKSELLDGVQHLESLMGKVAEGLHSKLGDWMAQFQDDARYDEATATATSGELHDLFLKHPTRHLANESDFYKAYVDRAKARFSTWYEFFPRSSSPEPGKHGTFLDCMNLLPRVADMGFDVIYFPPIHPIGEKNRKGKNNAVNAEEGDAGVPWAIGSHLGGHKSIHPQLGTEADFEALIAKARDQGIEIAMDIAFQAAPDHPYIEEHPEWFRKRPDGTIQYAENPPKKYQDIVNFYFETKAYQKLWKELLSIVQYWVDKGITIFRVDNPHTKPYYFWNWLIGEIKKNHPDVLFLAEAFSRPRVMQQLAKQGFSQSYTYFTWRVHKQEIEQYLLELTQTDMKEYYRPNFWPNTPDINPYHLQGANEPMHLIRYALAATLSSNIGLYGPVYEFMVTAALPGKEEYLDCEKYEIRHWDWSAKNKLTYLITRINHIRKRHASLQQTNNIRFCFVENDYLIAFYKWNRDKSDETLIVINLDSQNTQQGFVQLPMEDLGMHSDGPITVTDLITDNRYDWASEWNFVSLNPDLPFHIFHISR